MSTIAIDHTCCSLSIIETAKNKDIIDPVLCTSVVNYPNIEETMHSFLFISFMLGNIHTLLLLTSQNIINVNFQFKVLIKLYL